MPQLCYEIEGSTDINFDKFEGENEHGLEIGFLCSMCNFLIIESAYFV